LAFQTFKAETKKSPETGAGFSEDARSNGVKVKTAVIAAELPPRSTGSSTHVRSVAAPAIRLRPHGRADRRDSWPEPGGMDEASDEDLMQRVAKGDEPAFRLLAGRYAGRALNLARRITGNPADAEEVVQEALLRIWINAPRWRPLAAFRTWFYRVVLNLCLSRRRRAPFLPLAAAGDPIDTSADPAARMEDDEVARLVATAIAELPDRQRAAIVLTYDEGLSNAEAAAILETSISGVEALLVRAKRVLREKLGSRMQGYGGGA
jgi:RNA polymerase sigma-70 factor (ECF subfamily)